MMMKQFLSCFGLLAKYLWGCLIPNHWVRPAQLFLLFKNAQTKSSNKTWGRRWENEEFGIIHRLSKISSNSGRTNATWFLHITLIYVLFLHTLATLNFVLHVPFRRLFVVGSNGTSRVERLFKPAHYSTQLHRHPTSYLRWHPLDTNSKSVIIPFILASSVLLFCSRQAAGLITPNGHALEEMTLLPLGFRVLLESWKHFGLSAAVSTNTHSIDNVSNIIKRPIGPRLHSYSMLEQTGIRNYITPEIIRTRNDDWWSIDW